MTSKQHSFSNRVRRVVAAIPLGKVMTYADVATMAGVPHAYRAVGTIMAKNQDATIPCHRVIRSDRCIGAYNRGGPQQKKEKLQAEGVHVKTVRGKHFVI